MLQPIFPKDTEKHRCWSLFFNTAETLLKKRLKDTGAFL